MKNRNPNGIKLPTVSLAGRYRFEVNHPDGSQTMSPWHDNLITNIGLEAIGEEKEVFRYCMVGAGNTAPANGNATLQLQLASMDFHTVANPNVLMSEGIETDEPRFGWARRSYPFAQGSVDGNVAEVGVGWNGTNTFSRSLVTPAVSVTPIDQLTVVYELRVYVNEDDVTGTIDIEGDDYDFTIRALGAANAGRMGQAFGWSPYQLLNIQAVLPRPWVIPTFTFGGAEIYGAPVVLGPITEEILKQTLGGANGIQTPTFFNSVLTNHAYTANSKTAKFTCTWGTGGGNEPSGIQGFRFTGLFGTYQMVLDTVYGPPSGIGTKGKDNTKTLSIRFFQSWARH